MLKCPTTAKEIFNLNARLEKAENIFNSAKNALSNERYDKFVADMIRGCVFLESTTLYARNCANFGFKSCNMDFKSQNLVKEISEKAHNIKAELMENNVFHLSLPATLPHYKENYKCMLYEPLNYAFKSYQKEHGNFPTYDKVVIAVVNNVSKKNACGIRDNDNYDYKQIINATAFWLLGDDDFNSCDMYNCTKISEANSTDVYVIPQHYFPTFFQHYIQNNSSNTLK